MVVSSQGNPNKRPEELIMPRPELPLERDGSPVREFAYWLRDIRRRSDLTYEQLSKRTGYSRSTLQEALSGKRLPTLQVTLAITGACGGDRTDWADYWSQMHRAIDPDAPAPLLTESLLPPWITSHAGPSTDSEACISSVDSNTKVHERAGEKRSLRDRRGWILITGVGIVIIVTGVAILLFTSNSEQNGIYRQSHNIGAARATGTLRTYPEEEYNKNGASTFRFLNGSSPGQPLEFREFIQVSCKIHNTALQSAQPDGYWYRISSFPWDNHYYAVANTFLNGDPPSGPYTHNTDFEVPNC
jgi:transcriptional regulator with XRE-family HTH domain